jgi:hypothetical protein
MSHSEAMSIPAFIALALVQLQSPFDADAVKWVETPGHSTVSGQAFLRLADGTWKGCAGFNIELLPVAEYSNERIGKTYGNNVRGQILLEQDPPKFTPDAKEYHEMLLSSRCDPRDRFEFKNVPAGDFYVMAFIIWEQGAGPAAKKAGGAVMTRIKVAANSENQVLLRIEPELTRK